jgi:hypothetical protein
MSWIRSGECCRCGQCCIGRPPWADRDDLDPGDPILRTPPVQGMCPLYELHHGAPEGDGFCIGHNLPNQHGYYLSGCNVWPEHPNQIADKPGCSYKFTWQDD